MAPITVKFSFRYGSHLPYLLKACLETKGNILELGAGLFSTPMLNALSRSQDRKVLTLENFKRWYRWFSIYESKNHQVQFVKDWDSCEVLGEWDVVLVDMTPDKYRSEFINKLKDRAKIFVIHDSDSIYDKQYGYSNIYGEFSHRYDSKETNPRTTILSNYFPVEEFFK